MHSSLEQCDNQVVFAVICVVVNCLVTLKCPSSASYAAGAWSPHPHAPHLMSARAGKIARQASSIETLQGYGCNHCATDFLGLVHAEGHGSGRKNEGTRVGASLKAGIHPSLLRRVLCELSSDNPAKLSRLQRCCSAVSASLLMHATALTTSLKVPM